MQNPLNLDFLKPLAEELARKGRASAEEHRQVIVALCQGRFLTADQLAMLCNREVAGFRSRHLSPMVRNGDLLLRYPNSPNRPDRLHIG